ncbi:MAG: hypothetical protein ACTS6A_00335 [Candidatus Hodgkinia cicadicola]
MQLAKDKLFAIEWDLAKATFIVLRLRKAKEGNTLLVKFNEVEIIDFN